MKEKTIDIPKNNIVLQSQAIHGDNKNTKKSLHVLEDGASGWY